MASACETFPKALPKMDTGCLAFPRYGDPLFEAEISDGKLSRVTLPAWGRVTSVGTWEIQGSDHLEPWRGTVAIQGVPPQLGPRALGDGFEAFRARGH